VAYLASEQFILMSLALASGAAVGLLTSILFVPYLQVGVTPGIPIPPFKVLIGWSEAGWLSLAFGAVLMVTIIGTIIYLVRLKVFQAVKLGETI
jgi:putative ABC transport system permease protein